MTGAAVDNAQGLVLQQSMGFEPSTKKLEVQKEAASEPSGGQGLATP